MHRHQHKTTRIKNSQANITSPNGQNKVPVTNSKETEMYDIPDGEFKIAV